MAEVEGISVVTEQCLQELLDFFVKSAYKARTVDRRYEIIHKRCIHLVGRDYKIDVIDNKLGQLCAHYPSELIVIARELEEGEIQQSHDDKKCINSVTKLRELIPAARFARCRSRFVMPVILFENKNICRSATLSSMAELYGRSGFDWILTLPTIGNDLEEKSQQTPPDLPTPPTNQNSPESESSTSESSDWVLLNRVRGQDVQLLKALRVDLICDLMVEKKKLKYGIYVCSSEKVDKWARYSDFSIASMPYPGCEFFKDYRDNGYNAVSLKFDWKQAFVDAELTVPADLEGAIDMPYNRYQEWDLIEITQNYLKMLIQYLTECDGGILIHCISGWDRTPLFISLLRLSLWADGKAHNSLCPAEMLYFTLAYDWLIYGHQLKERHDKGEEVLYFCFDFLKYITTEDFSVLNRQSKLSRLNGMPSSSDATPTGAREGRSSSRASKERECRTNQSYFHSSHSYGSNADSWMGVDSESCHTPSSSSSSSLTTPIDAPNGRCTAPEHHFSTTGSWQQVSLDHVNQRCTYHGCQSSPDPADKSSSHLSSQSTRAKRLNAVRELFLKAFRTSIPELPGNSTSNGPLAGITGFFSKLASSVINN